jgi:hypothetical protein
MPRCDGEAGLFRQCDRRLETDADDDEVTLEMFSALQRDASLVYRDRGRSEMERYPVLLVI